MWSSSMHVYYVTKGHNIWDIQVRCQCTSVHGIEFELCACIHCVSRVAVGRLNRRSWLMGDLSKQHCCMRLILEYPGKYTYKNNRMNYTKYVWSPNQCAALC